MGKKVLDFKENQDSVIVYTHDNAYKAKFVIVAEGSQGRLKNRIRRKDTKGEYGICLVTEIEEDNEIIDNYIHNAIDIHLGVTKRGYGWISPHEKYYSIGIAGIAKELSNPRRRMKDFLAANGFTGNYKVNQHVIPVGGIKRNI